MRVTGAANAVEQIVGSADKPVIRRGAEADRPLKRHLPLARREIGQVGVVRQDAGHRLQRL